MRKPLAVEAIPSAAQQIRDAAAWWRENAEYDILLEAVERAFNLLAMQPYIGAPASSSKLQGVRRLHLSRVHYHLYYRVFPQQERVEILALWHTGRGSPPPLE